MGSSSHKLA
ncbi:hypothetical protein RDI58_007489 [Solanum bulbocastanum]|uniref:Uncharacterized protein n=1 Tax=Solanum bulbocastanum TaxID=147425 RepID=A0AAN8YJ99_SOLBU